MLKRSCFEAARPMVRARWSWLCAAIAAPAIACGGEPGPDIAANEVSDAESPAQSVGLPGAAPEASSLAACQTVPPRVWGNQAFAAQSGRFHVEIDATPSTAAMDAVIGLSSNAAVSFAQLAAIARFNASGQIDVRSGSTYRADTTFTYQANTTYHLRFDVDLRGHRYSVFVRTPFGMVALARDYAFRTEQAGVTLLANVANEIDAAVGSFTTCDPVVVADGTTADGCVIADAGAGFVNLALPDATVFETLDVAVTPRAAGLDAVVGVSAGPASSFSQLAAATRFSADNILDIHDATGYRADVVRRYSPGTQYSFRMVLDLTTHTYSVFQGILFTFRDFVELGKQYRFRSAQSAVAHLDNLDFSFREAPFFADRMIELRDVAFGYDDALLFKDLSLKVRAGDRIGVIGKNGKGKSTLLNVMAGELKPKHGEIESHPDLKIGFFGQTNIQRLHPKMTVEEEIGEANVDLSRTAVRNICGTMMFSGDNAEKKVSVLSGGEKSRVLLGKILATPSNLLLLDEPTNHLDMESIEALLDSLQEFEGAVVIVTHSEMILKDLATKLVVFRKGGVETIDGSYEEFLEKYGWEEEGEAPAAAPSKREGKVNKKELRKKRAELTAERSKLLGPLAQKIEKLEAQITQWESEMKAANQGILDASSGGNSAELARLSRSVKELQSRIDLAFDQLAGLQAEHDRQSKQFDAQLAELE